MNGYGGPTRLLDVAVAPQNGSPDREPSVSVLAFSIRFTRAHQHSLRSFPIFHKMDAIARPRLSSRHAPGQARFLAHLPSAFRDTSRGRRGRFCRLGIEPDRRESAARGLVVIKEGGVFNGESTTEDADVQGCFDGKLVVRKRF